MKKYNYYLLTIKTRGAAITELYELYDFYLKLKSKLTETEFSDLRVFEYAKDLHFHTIVISTKDFPEMLKNRKARVYSHFKKFPPEDYDNIRNYLLKQVPDRDEQISILRDYHLSKFNYWSNQCDYENLQYYNFHPIKV